MLEYKDLMPTDSIKPESEYLKALEWAFGNKKIKNIALAGPYGSGKSSIIESFLAHDKSEYEGCCNKFKRKLFGEKTINDVSLKISMATFAEGIKKDNKDGKISVEIEEVEKGILKQLFYKVDYRKIPQSRYKKLHNVSFLKMLLLVLLTAIVFVFFATLLIPKTCTNAINRFLYLADKFPVSPIIYYIITGIVVVILLLLTSFIYRWIISRFRIKEIKIPVNATVQNDGGDKESIFNKNLEEIIYFFEVMKYRIVFFEDLDRLDDRKIFVHLRELNNLLNNDDAIKEKPIVFVYAVNDDIFTEKDRTKFFDFIIPVIPVVNSTNSGEELLERLDLDSENNMEIDFNQDFILDISPFVSDMRILQNICNEFLVYKKTLHDSQGLSLYDDKMFAMVVFKNIYPSDFADIQNETGVLKQVFEDKRKYIELKIKELQNDIKKNDRLIEKKNNDNLHSVRELKAAMLSAITGWQGIATRIYDYGSGQVSAKQILDSDYDLRQLRNTSKDMIYIRQYDGNDKSIRIDDLDNCKTTINNYIDRWETLRRIESEGIEAIQNTISELKEQVHSINRLSLKELMEEYPEDSILSENVKDNGLLVFLLRRGYIDENYDNYINYFKPNSLTTGDMNFILAVKNQSKIPYDYPLTKKEMVIQNLQCLEFEQKNIYNYDLLEALLKSTKYTDKLEAFIKQLADETDDSWLFIDSFIDRTNYESRLIQELSEKWAGIWKFVSNKDNLTYERQLKYLSLILQNVDNTTLCTLNVDNCITDYFVRHSDILQKMAAVKTKRMIKAIQLFNICFKKLDIENVSKEILSYVFDNNYYEINEDMIRNVVTYIDKTKLPSFRNKNYTTICELSYEPLINYIQGHMLEYVSKVLSTKKSAHDNIEHIIDMIERLDGYRDWCTLVIEIEAFTLEKITDCEGDRATENNMHVKSIWDAIIIENKLNITWENIILYWNIYGLSDTLLQFIEHNADLLRARDVHEVDDLFIKDFISSGCKQDTLQKLLPVLRMEDFDFELGSLPKNIIEIMVDCNYFKFTVARYLKLVEIDYDIAFYYIIKNQKDFIKVVDEIQMNTDLFEDVIIHEEIEREIKTAVFDEYSLDYMTDTVAENMNKFGMHITLEVFDKAWNCISKEKKEKLMFDNLDKLDANTFNVCFSELGGRYRGFIDRSKRHDVEFKCTDKNLQLAERLKQVQYITSYAEKTIEVFNPTLGTNESNKVIIFRIKKEKQIVN